MTHFGRETTAAAVAATARLEGRVVVVTGASGGIGAETARALAHAGATVVLAARDLGRAEQVVAAIRAEVPDAPLQVEALALTDFAGVRRCAQRIVDRYGAITALVANAGVMACPLTRTAEGYELHFATNHLGHFLLTIRLLPALIAGAPARVAVVSSAGHRLSAVRFDDLHFTRRPYDRWTAYGQSKTANALFALALDRRVAGRGVRAYALHPGAIPTDLGRHLRAEDLRDLAARTPGARLEWKTVEQGAATSVWAVTTPTLAAQGGLYLEDCAVAGPATDDAPRGYEPWALDGEAAEELWRVSEELVGERVAA